MARTRQEIADEVMSKPLYPDEERKPYMKFTEDRPATPEEIADMSILNYPSKDTYGPPRVLANDRVKIIYVRPILTPEEREKRLARIAEAAGHLLFKKAEMMVEEIYQRELAEDAAREQAEREQAEREAREARDPLTLEKGEEKHVE